MPMPRQPGSVRPYGHHREPAGLDQRTTLKRVSPHRLHALVLEVLERYPNSGLSAPSPPP
jgi:hypothetical protein